MLFNLILFVARELFLLVVSYHTDIQVLHNLLQKVPTKETNGANLPSECIMHFWYSSVYKKIVLMHNKCVFC